MMLQGTLPHVLAAPAPAPTLSDFNQLIWWLVLLKVGIVFVFLLLTTMFMIWLERRVIGHRRDLGGNGHRAAVGDHGHLIAVGHAGLGRGRRGYPGHDRAGSARERRLAVLHAPAVQQLVPAG